MTLREGEPVRIFTSSTTNVVPLPLKGKDLKAPDKGKYISLIGRFSAFLYEGKGDRFAVDEVVNILGSL